MLRRAVCAYLDMARRCWGRLLPRSGSGPAWRTRWGPRPAPPWRSSCPWRPWRRSGRWWPPCPSTETSSTPASRSWARGPAWSPCPRCSMRTAASPAGARPFRSCGGCREIVLAFQLSKHGDRYLPERRKGFVEREEVHHGASFLFRLG